MKLESVIVQTKAAYIYDEDDNRKYWGADASSMHISATITMVVYDDAKMQHANLQTLILT